MLSIIMKNNFLKILLLLSKIYFAPIMETIPTVREKKRRDNIVKENENNLEKNPGR